MSHDYLNVTLLQINYNVWTGSNTGPRLLQCYSTSNRSRQLHNCFNFTSHRWQGNVKEDSVCSYYQTENILLNISLHKLSPRRFNLFPFTYIITERRTAKVCSWTYCGGYCDWLGGEGLLFHVRPLPLLLLPQGWGCWGCRQGCWGCGGLSAELPGSSESGNFCWGKFLNISTERLPLPELEEKRRKSIVILCYGNGMSSMMEYKSKKKH